MKIEIELTNYLIHTHNIYRKKADSIHKIDKEEQLPPKLCPHKFMLTIILCFMNYYISHQYRALSRLTTRPIVCREFNCNLTVES